MEVLSDSDVPIDLIEFVKNDLGRDDFPSDYIVEAADYGYILTEVYAESYKIICRPHPTRTNLGIFINTKPELSANAEEQYCVSYGYGYQHSGSKPYIVCASAWRINDLIRSASSYSSCGHESIDATRLVKSITKVIADCPSSPSIASIFNSMVSLHYYPFDENIKWLN